MRRIVLLLCLPMLLGGVSTPPRVDNLAIPGPGRFVKVARDVVDIAFTLDPSLAASAGLFEDAARVPSFAPAQVDALVTRLDRDLAALSAMKTERWPVDTRIDHRWVSAYAETLRHQLTVERPYTHRPAQWLEPVANDLIALQSYAPDRTDLQDALWAGTPAMLTELRGVCTDPTRRDVDTARKLASALREMASAHPAAKAALATFLSELDTLHPTQESTVIGPAAYAWRFQHALLFPWTPDALLARAEAELVEIDQKLASAPERWTPGPPTAEQTALARRFDQAELEGLYDALSERHRTATVAGAWVTIPASVGSIRARATPRAMIPLTGDGGSMNPPPTFVADNTGYWNVEHLDPAGSEAQRLQTIQTFQAAAENGMGPYAAHEGFPGHHLQLAIARLNPDPLRSILPDPAQNEGWALYAEEAFLEFGGFGDSERAKASVLRSYRGRVARVVYDVRIETGVWSLQQGADWKYGGQGKVDEDVLRSINWPTQLVSYYGGKAQIVALRADWKARTGGTDRAFHDAFLAEGSIPIALIRAKMLGEPIP